MHVRLDIDVVYPPPIHTDFSRRLVVEAQQACFVRPFLEMDLLLFRLHRNSCSCDWCNETLTRRVCVLRDRVFHATESIDKTNNYGQEVLLAAGMDVKPRGKRRGCLLTGWSMTRVEAAWRLHWLARRRSRPPFLIETQLGQELARSASPRDAPLTQSKSLRFACTLSANTLFVLRRAASHAPAHTRSLLVHSHSRSFSIISCRSRCAANRSTPCYPVKFPSIETFRSSS